MAKENENRKLPVTCGGHTRPVVNLDFSGINEGFYYLVSASKDGLPMLRKGDTGDWMGTFVGHKGAIWDAKINELGTVAATGAADFSAKVWSAVNGIEFYSFNHGHVVKTVAFDNNSEHLLTGGNEKVLRIFDLCNPYAVPYLFEGHTAPIKSALFCRNDKCLISISEDKTLRVWDKASGNEVQRITFPIAPSSMTLSADKNILTTAHGTNLSFWMVDSLKKLKELQLQDRITAACLHPNNELVICGCDDFKIHKIDYQTGQQLKANNGHFGTIHSVKFSPDGEIFASGSEDGTLRLWQTSPAKPFQKYQNNPFKLYNNRDEN